MDAAELKFADESFDIVYAPYLISVVPDPVAVAREMYRVCRPGGRIIMLNHFSNGNKVINAVERVLSPLTKHLGWRTDLSLNTVLEGTSLHVARKQKVNPLRLWALVECENRKNGSSHVSRTGAEHSVAGYANGNGASSYSNGNGRYSHEPAH